MAESWIAKCGSRLICELLPEKEILYVIPISSILGKLPTVRAGDTGTIPYQYVAPIVLAGTLPVLILLKAVEMTAQCIS